MLTENLFEEILIKPVKQGGNRLFVISGYATSAMAFHHFESLKDINSFVKIELIVGMCYQDGLSESNHKGLKKLMEEDFSSSFKCSYLVNPPPVHSKVYAWYQDEKPLFGYIGSANYTQTAFSRNRRECMSGFSAKECYGYFESLRGETIYCSHIDAESFVNIYNNKVIERLKRERVIDPDQEVTDRKTTALTGLPFVRISLLGDSGDLPSRSGLNWGQRPEYSREPNQAYIRVPAEVYRTDFFPERGIHFTIHTDDNKVLICTRAQENGKAIETPENNSLIGIYFRNRLNLRSGVLVTKDDLLRYGRTHIDFYKVDNESYYMDFSKIENG